MKKFERALKIIHRYDAEGYAGVFQGVDGLTESDLRFLSAKNLVKLSPAGDNELFAELTSKGRTYFSDKKERALRSVKDRLVGFVIGVAATVAADLLIRFLSNTK